MILVWWWLLMFFSWFWFGYDCSWSSVILLRCWSFLPWPCLGYDRWLLVFASPLVLLTNPALRPPTKGGRRHQGASPFYFLLRCLLTFYLAYPLTFCLAYLLTFYVAQLLAKELRCGSEHWALIVLVEIRQGTLNVAGCGWGPAAITGRGRSWSRFGSKYWAWMVVVEVRQNCECWAISELSTTKIAPNHRTMQPTNIGQNIFLIRGACWAISANWPQQKYNQIRKEKCNPIISEHISVGTVNANTSHCKPCIKVWGQLPTAKLATKNFRVRLLNHKACTKYFKIAIWWEVFPIEPDNPQGSQPNVQNCPFTAIFADRTAFYKESVSADIRKTQF